MKFKLPEMKKERFKVLKAIIVILVLILIVFSSCEKEDEGSPPQIPDISTFQMDFDDWPTHADTVLKNLSAIQQTTYQNWLTGVVEVTIWNLAVAATMYLPVASFVESFNHEPVYHTDGKYWTWSYNFNYKGLHTAELRGYYIPDSVVWEMRVDNILAYEGKVHSDGKQGYWMLKRQLSDSYYWLQIDWQRENETVGEIKYTNIVPTDSLYNGYIHYGATNGTLNRFYNIYKPIADKLVQIEWNYPDHQGRIKNEIVFQNQEWHCWDELLRDVACE